MSGLWRIECSHATLRHSIWTLQLDDAPDRHHLKVPGPICQNKDFYSNDASSPNKSWLQISVKSVTPLGHKKRLHILQMPIPYCVN